MPDEKNWMEELKEGSSAKLEGLKAGVANQAPPGWCFSGRFKFQVGEKVRSRIHEANAIVEHCEFTRYIASDQISYKIRFNDPEDMKTDTSLVDEEWLEKI
jgi:hypothetical protein